MCHPHNATPRTYVVLAGAVEGVLAVCRHYAIGYETGLLDESYLASAKETTAKLNADFG